MAGGEGAAMGKERTPIAVGPFKKRWVQHGRSHLVAGAAPVSAEYNVGDGNRTIHTPFFSFYKAGSCAPPKRACP